MSRHADLDRLYALLEELEAKVGGKQRLDDYTGYMDWPERGVYFSFAPDETRDTTDQLRLTRIGMHAVSTGSSASLWNRLRTRRGAKSGSYEDGGKHRGSVFRKRVGEAMIERDGLDDETHPGVREPVRAGIDGWRSCRMNGASASTFVTSRSSGLMSTTSPAPRSTACTSNGT